MVAAAVLGAFAMISDAPLVRAVETPLEIDVTSIAFGDVNVGNSASATATLTNSGSVPMGPLNLFGGAPPTAAFSATQNCQGATLAPGGTCTVTYTFAPTAPGAFADQSTFIVSPTGDQADGEEFTVALSGTGVNPIAAAPLDIDFGDVLVGTTSPAIAVVVTNTSADPFGPLNLFGGAPPTAAFSAAQNCQGTTLAPGGTCTVSYTFAPTSPGTFTDVSSFAIGATGDQSAGTAFSIGLAGCGVQTGTSCPSPATPTPTPTPSPIGAATPGSSASASVPGASASPAGTASPAAGLLPDTSAPPAAVQAYVAILGLTLVAAIAATGIRARRGS